MNRAWRYVFPCYVLTAPLALVGLLLAILVYRASYFSTRDGVVTCIAGSFERSLTPKGPHETVTRIWGRPGAQTFAWLQIYANEHERQRADLRVHETVHTVQAFFTSLVGLLVLPLVLAGGHFLVVGALISAFGGVALYALAYGLAFLVPFAVARFSNWKDAYRSNWFERQAYDAQADYLEMRPVDQARVWGHR